MSAGVPDLETNPRKPVADAAPTNRRVLVTGGSGFIGQHLVAALRRRGEIVRVLDQRSPPTLFPSEFIEGTILDPGRVRRAMEGVDTVYHLAAISHLWTRDRNDYEDVNHRGTLLVLAAAREMGVPNFIHCSTEAILFPTRGSTELPARVEDMPGPYTRSKFLAEQAAFEAARNGMHVVIASPTIPVGPGDHSFTAPTAMLSLFVHQPPALVLDCSLNLVDVRDAANGLILARERGQSGERYILGGENIRVRELARRVGRLCGRRTTPYPIPGPVALAAGIADEWFEGRVMNRRPHVSAEAVRVALRSIPLDISTAQVELGYDPRPINRALIDAVAWLSGREASEPRRAAAASQPR
jgi:dihydroflavonol-4-reductase